MKKFLMAAAAATALLASGSAAMAEAVKLQLKWVTQAQFAGRLLREGHCDDVAHLGTAAGEHRDDAGDEFGGLARTRRRLDDDRGVQIPLFLVLANLLQLRFDGLLWRLTRTGRAPSFVFGTIYFADPRLTELPPEVLAALKAEDISAPPRLCCAATCKSPWASRTSTVISPLSALLT